MGEDEVYAGTIPPRNPKTGDLWFDTSSEHLNSFYDKTWVEIGGSEVMDSVFDSQKQQELTEEERLKIGAYYSEVHVGGVSNVWIDDEQVWIKTATGNHVVPGHMVVRIIKGLSITPEGYTLDPAPGFNTCMWCGLTFQEESVRDEHEEACA